MSVCASACVYIDLRDISCSVAGVLETTGRLLTFSVPVGDGVYRNCNASHVIVVLLSVLWKARLFPVHHGGELLWKDCNTSNGRLHFHPDFTRPAF